MFFIIRQLLKYRKINCLSYFFLKFIVFDWLTKLIQIQITLIKSIKYSIQLISQQNNGFTFWEHHLVSHLVLTPNYFPLTTSTHFIACTLILFSLLSLSVQLPKLYTTLENNSLWCIGSHTQWLSLAAEASHSVCQPTH